MEAEVRKAPAQLSPFWKVKKAIYYVDSSCPDNVYSDTHFSLSIIQLFHSDNGWGTKAKKYTLKSVVFILMNGSLQRQGTEMGHYFKGAFRF